MSVAEVGGLLLSATSAGRLGVVESSRVELGENSAGAKKSWTGRCRAILRQSREEHSILAEGDILANGSVVLVTRIWNVRGNKNGQNREHHRSRRWSDDSEPHRRAGMTQAAHYGSS